jgi:hypothetical protein
MIATNVATQIGDNRRPNFTTFQIHVRSGCLCSFSSRMPYAYSAYFPSQGSTFLPTTSSPGRSMLQG